MIVNDNRNCIVILTDLGNCARNAADYGYQLAANLKTNVILFYSYDEPVFSRETTSNEKLFARREHGIEKLNKEAARLTTLPVNGNKSFVPRIDCIVEEGNMAENVSSIIGDKGNVLQLVMGGYKARNNDDFQSSTAIKDILGKIRCPVTIVPEYEFIKL